MEMIVDEMEGAWGPWGLIGFDNGRITQMRL